MADSGTNAGKHTAGAAPLPDKQLLDWQRNLLPFMLRFMVALAVVFFVLSIYDALQVKSSIFTEHGDDIRAVMQLRVASRPGELLTPAESTQGALLLLESEVLDKRYHQASALLMSRIWTKHLSFLTGMVLAFLGATFILGKLSEGSSNISGSGAGWKADISSASPGIILAFFGTVLLAISLTVQAKIEVEDSPVYVYGTGVISAPRLAPSPTPVDAKDGVSPLPPPPDILDAGKVSATPRSSKR